MEAKVFRQGTLEGFDPTQVYYPDEGGTQIPMFIVHKKDVPLQSENLFFPIVTEDSTSVYSPPSQSLGLRIMQNFDGVVAIANIRGGGEYAGTWHNGGRLLSKQNDFDDFQAAAEYLIANNYTLPSKLVVQGGSNGGLLVGACVSQRADLLGAGIAQVGVMDMLRFHKLTISYAVCSDYGCSNEKEHLDNLYKFSPIHNVRPPTNGTQYPTVLLLTADHDDRVVPLHFLKFISDLQENMGKLPSPTNPLMLRVETKAGNGAGKPTAEVIEEHTDILSFLVQSLEFKWKT